MLNLANFDGEIYVNGNKVNTFNPNLYNGVTIIKLVPRNRVRTVVPKEENHVQKVDGHTNYKITVKAYMTKPASIDFDFMEKYNHNNPMPLVTMTGWVEKETKGMVYMHLKGMAEETITCMRCGRELTNPISRAYGIGPECLCKLGIVADISAVDEIKEKLVETTWEGWIIKSAILKQEEV